MPKTACPVVWEGPGAQSLVTRPDNNRKSHSKIAKAAKTDFRKFKGPVFATFVALLWNIFSSWLCELVVNYFVFARR